MICPLSHPSYRALSTPPLRKKKNVSHFSASRIESRLRWGGPVSSFYSDSIPFKCYTQVVRWFFLLATHTFENLCGSIALSAQRRHLHHVALSVRCCHLQLNVCRGASKKHNVNYSRLFFAFAETASPVLKNKNICLSLRISKHDDEWDSSRKLFIYCETHPQELFDYRLNSFPRTVYWPTHDGERLRVFYHNCRNSILQQLETKKLELRLGLIFGFRSRRQTEQKRA